MKRLTLVRHAKSSWEKLALADMERPLTRRGRQDAEHMGAWLAEGGDAPDIILVSPARRTRKTAKRLVAALPGCAERILVDPALYAADAGLLLQRLRHLDECWRHVMLIAHNPGLLDLINELTGAGLGKLPTCSVAVVDLMIDSWAAAAPASGALALLMTPKRLVATRPGSERIFNGSE